MKQKLILMALLFMFGKGVFAALTPHNMTNFPKIDPINYDEITCMVKSGTKIYAGTRYNGVQVFNGSSWNSFNSGLPIWHPSTPSNYKTIKHILLNGNYVYVAVEGSTATTSGVFRSLTTTQAWTQRSTLLPKDPTNTFYDITCLATTSWGILAGTSTGKVRFLSSTSGTWASIDANLENTVNSGGFPNTPINSITLFNNGSYTVNPNYQLAIGTKSGVYIRSTDFPVFAPLGTPGNWGSYTTVQSFFLPCYKLVAIGGTASNSYSLLGIGGDIVLGPSTIYLKSIIRFNYSTNFWDVNTSILYPAKNNDEVLLDTNKTNVVLSKNLTTSSTPEYIKSTSSLQGLSCTYGAALSSSPEKPSFMSIENASTVYVALPNKGLYTSTFASFKKEGGNEGVLNFEDMSKNVVTCYPNPVSNFLNVSLLGEDSFTNFEIVDIKGHVVKEAQLEKATTLNIDLQSMVKGIYFLRLVLSNGEIKIQRIVKD